MEPPPTTYSNRPPRSPQATPSRRGVTWSATVAQNRGLGFSSESKGIGGWKGPRRSLHGGDRHQRRRHRRDQLAGQGFPPVSPPPQPPPSARTRWDKTGCTEVGLGFFRLDARSGEKILSPRATQGRATHAVHTATGVGQHQRTPLAAESTPPTARGRRPSTQRPTLPATTRMTSPKRSGSHPTHGARAAPPPRSSDN